MHKNPGLIISIPAAADLEKHLFVGFDGNVCGANAKALGVSDVETAVGDVAPVIVTGIALVLLSATVTIGAPLVSDSTGKAAPASALSAVVPSGATAVLSSSAEPTMTMAGGILPQTINGYALEAGDAGDVIRVRLA